MELTQLLGVAVVILLALQAFGVAAGRVSLGWAGLAVWALVALVL